MSDQAPPSRQLWHHTARHQRPGAVLSTASAAASALWLARLYALNGWARAVVAASGLPELFLEKRPDLRHAIAAGAATPVEAQLALHEWLFELPVRGIADQHQALEGLAAALVRERRAACLARWTAGSAAWNEWAGAMTAIRGEMRDAGAWQLQTGGAPGNALTASFLQLAEADFEGQSLGRANFIRTVFPGRANFTRTVFGDPAVAAAPVQSAAQFHFARFEGPGLVLDGASFTGDAYFDGIDVAGGALSLRDVKCSGVAWFNDARVECEEANFSGARFEGGACFDGATLKAGRIAFAGARFAGAGASCRDTRFEGGAIEFDGASIGGASGDFTRACFEGSTASFRDATFGGPMTFAEARFLVTEVCFDGAALGGSGLSFRAARFAGALSARRGGAGQVGAAGRVVRFAGPACFDGAVFEGPFDASGAAFEEAASFAGVRAAASFSLTGATFAVTPDFRAAEFRFPPRLDGLAIRSPLGRQPGPTPAVARSGMHHPDPRLAGRRRWHWLYRRFGVARDGEEHERFRSLRGLAAAARDDRSALHFRAHELAARRFWIDAPWLDGPGRFWLTWGYGMLTGYGRSLGRPIAAWLVLVAVGALALIALAAPPPGAAAPSAADAAGRPLLLSEPITRWGERLGELWGVARGRLSALEPCKSKPRALGTAEASAAGPGDGALLAALELSWRNALLADHLDDRDRLHGCLFGLAPASGGRPSVPPLASVLLGLQRLASGLLMLLAAATAWRLLRSG
jgi:uncharacterized protein YjbI with pentapeptide repeats